MHQHAGGALIVLAALQPAASESPPGCPVGEENPCVIHLREKERSAVSANCAAEPWKRYLTFRQPNGVSDSDGDGWWETVVELDLDPAGGCRCARFRVHYGSEPSGYTMHVADSATSDGHGGDGSPLCAEAYVQGTALSVLSAILEPGTRGYDRVLHQEFPSLAGGTLDVRVCDQELAFELSPAGEGGKSWKTELSALNAQHLIALSSRPYLATVENQADWLIHAAFNRVVHRRDGPPAKKRVGAGVNKVEILLTP